MKISIFEIFFDLKERERLINLMNEGNVKELEKLKPSAIDSLKLRIASTRDRSFCCSQVVAYVPYEYVNCTEVREHSPEETEILLRLNKKR